MPSDQNEAGGRAGITVMTGPRTSFSVGLVYDRRINCDKTVYSSCSETLFGTRRSLSSFSGKFC